MREHRGSDREYSRGSSPRPSGAGNELEPVRPKTPEDHAVDRVSRFRSHAERAASHATKLGAILLLEDWRTEKAALEKQRAELGRSVAEREKDAAVSEQARGDFEAAKTALAAVADALERATAPRSRPPVTHEIEIEPRIKDRSANADEVLAWAAGLNSGDRSALVRRLTEATKSADKDEFAIALGNYLAAARMTAQFRGVLANPKRFDAVAYARARSAREPSARDPAPPAEQAVAPAAPPTTAEPPESIVRRVVESGEPDPIALASIDVAERSALADRLASYRPGCGDELAARFARLDRASQVQILDALHASSPVPVTHDATQTAEMCDAAARGVAGVGGELPHLDRIQASFGRHDVSGVQAYVAGAAADASAALGATAYAAGDRVGFASAPDLHTAAHEAAHTVQQRAGVQLLGGVGREGDAYEQHADAVADSVVRGESAEALLDEFVSRGGHGGGGGAVQRKTGGKPEAGAEKEPELMRAGDAKWPVFAKTGQPYLVESRNGKPGFWVVRDWVAAAPDMTKTNGAMRAPSRARELLTAMGWVASTNMDFAVNDLNFRFHGALNHFEIGAEAAWATGMPKGRQAIVDRDGTQGLTVTLSLDDVTAPPGRPHAMTTSEAQRALQAAADFTRLSVDPTGHAFLMTSWLPALPMLRTGNGVITIDLNRGLCRTLFGPEAYNTWLGGKTERERADEPKTPKLKLENFYKRPIPGQLTHYGDLVEASEALRLEVLVDWPHHHPDPEIYDAPPMVTPSKLSNVALLTCAWRFERLDGAADGTVPRGATEMQSTAVAEALHRFRLAPGEASGTFRVTCEARFDEYFEPATFTRDIVVMSSAAAMSKLQAEAFAGLGAADTDRQKLEWTGDMQPGFKPSPAVGTPGDLDDPMARDRAAQRDRLHDAADYLRGSAASVEAVEALDREAARQERSEKLIIADRDKGWQPFQIRGTYLSRTEGLASGPLDLHGTVHVERHYDTYPGDGPSTTLRVRNDQVVVQIRDLSRRFEQNDFVFEGRADTFDDALRAAFNDLAVAYPKGMVSIEAEQMRGSALRTGDGTPGDDTALGPGTGKVIGFQRSTETTWKKVKEAVWDPVASVVVNLGAIALMTLVPGSAAVVAPALVAYNSAPSIDRVKTESDRGTLTVGTFAMSTGEIALNLLPLVSRAKPFTAGWYAVETANWGGQVALMGASAVDMAQHLQATQVAMLAQEYQQFLELQKTSLPSDPGLAIAEDHIRRKAAAIDDEISRQFWEQVQNNVFQIAAGSVIHNTSSHARTAIVDHLDARQGTAAITHTGDGLPNPSGDGAPRSPAAGGGPAPASDKLAVEAAADQQLRPDGGDFRADATKMDHAQTADTATGRHDHVARETTTAADAAHDAATREANSASKDERINAPKAGLFEGVDPGKKNVGDLEITDSKAKPDPKYKGFFTIVTEIVGPNKDRTGVASGWIERAYNPTTKELLMKNIFLDDLYSWVDHGGVALKDGKGIPLSTYLTIRQMKMLGAEYGNISTVRMTTIQNVRSVIELAYMTKNGESADIAIAKTYSVTYSTTTLTQSGLMVKSIKMDGNTGKRRLGDMLEWYESDGGSRDPRTNPNPIKKTEHEKALAEYGKGEVKRDDVVHWDYDVVIEVAPWGSP